MRRHSLLALSGIGLLMLLVVVFVLVLEETGPEASSYRISGGVYESGMNGSPAAGPEAAGRDAGGHLGPDAVIRSLEGTGHPHDGGLRQLAELPPAPTASEPEGGDPGDVSCVNDSAINDAGQLW